MLQIIVWAAIIATVIVIVRSMHVAATVEKARRLLPDLLGSKTIEGEDLRALLKVYGAKLSRRAFYRLMAEQHMWVRTFDSYATKVRGRSIKGFKYRRTCEPPTPPPRHMMFDKRK